MDELWTQPHRRHNPLTGDWVLVSPHRTDRPWLGEQAPPRSAAATPAYDPQCYLCPGNLRANGARNPAYEGTFAFVNDFSALLPDTPESAFESGELLIARSERGTCRVVCFSPRHDLHLASMPPGGIERVVDAWAREYAELASLPYVDAVTIFENRGAMMGASNPHPHSQIWADETVPGDLARETLRQRAYHSAHGRCLLCAYLEHELQAGERIVYAGDGAVVLVPFWAVWPFETMVLPRTHCGSLDRFDAGERAELAKAIADITARYDRLFGVPFPYSMGFHQRPCDGKAHDEWHAHAHYFPPLLRSAGVRKYMVGYEMLAQPQRDLLPEQAAQRLRGA